MSSAEPVNLVLVYHPGALDVADYQKIAQRVREVADNITVHIHEDRAAEPALLTRLARHRTMVYSPMQLRAFVIARGAVYAGRPMLKSEQLLRLELAGVPVPPWSVLDRGKRYDPGRWGEYVVVKPQSSSQAQGVKIMQTRVLNETSARVRQYERGRDSFLLQKLVFNPAFGKIRIETLFDEVLFARLFRFPEPLNLGTPEDVVRYEASFASETSRAEDFESAAVFALAKQCWRAFDGAVLLGLDVLLDEAGSPFFIEANPGGNTWHISSAARGQMLRARGTFLEAQFGAFERAGEVLARRALEDAL